MSARAVAWAVLQPALVLAAAPLINGVVRKTKASLQRRRGPGLLQHYRDLAKLFRKGTAISMDASWITRAAPRIIFSVMAVLAILIPVLPGRAPLGFAGDLFAFIYLLALARFFQALMGLDAGSAFGGEGSSREMALASIFEPPLALTLIVLALGTGTTQLAAVSSVMAHGEGISISASHVFLLCAFFLLVIAETARVPVDNPDTHLELTMVHEGMLLEASGPNLALVAWASMIKQLLFVTLLVNLFIPWSPENPAVGVAGWFVKTVFAAVALGFAETLTAKMRLFKLMDYSTLATGLALLALLFLIANP